MCHNDDHEERAEERDMAAEAAEYYRAHPGYRRAARRQGRDERDMAAQAADYYRAQARGYRPPPRQGPPERDMAAEAADYYRAQKRGYGPPRRRYGPDERGGETRHFNPSEPIPGEWSAHSHDAEPVGGPPPPYQEMGDPAAYYQARWHRGQGPHGFRGGRGFFGPWLLIPLLILLAVHSPLVGAVLLPIATLFAFWPLLLIGGAFIFFRRRSGFRRW